MDGHRVGREAGDQHPAPIDGALPDEPLAHLKQFGMASLAIIVFIWAWGAFLWPLVIVQDRELNVLAVGLTNYSQPYQRQPMWGAAMAASTVATIPIACLFVFFQRYFIKGLTAAAVKG